jgi:hypothetical protein
LTNINRNLNQFLSKALFLGKSPQQVVGGGLFAPALLMALEIAKSKSSAPIPFAIAHSISFSFFN